jgi:phospholipid/cholesterol/gamma-HCH transport system substrate-binding protein
MMEANRRASILVGALVLTTGIAFAAIVMFFGAAGSIFGGSVPITACFGDVTGLRGGAAVLLSGVRIGAVDKITLAGPCGDEAAVRLAIDRAQVHRLGADTGARLVTLGLLGDRLVALSPGKAQARLERGAVLHGQIPPDATAVIAQAGEAFDVLLHISRRIDTVLAGADIDRIVGNIAGATDALHRLLADAQNGHGLIHALVYDRTLPRRLQQLGTAVEQATAASGEAHHMMARLDQGAADLGEIVAHVKSGQGTLGGIIYDPAIYEDLRAIVGRVRRSFILRTLARFVIQHR